MPSQESQNDGLIIDLTVPNQRSSGVPSCSPYVSEAGIVSQKSMEELHRIQYNGQQVMTNASEFISRNLAQPPLKQTNSDSQMPVKKTLLNPGISSTKKIAEVQRKNQANPMFSCGMIPNLCSKLSCMSSQAINEQNVNLFSISSPKRQWVSNIQPQIQSNINNSRKLYQGPFCKQEILNQGPGDGISYMGLSNDLDSSAMMSVLSERQVMSFKANGKFDTNMEMINELKKYKLQKIQTEISYGESKSISYFQKLQMINKFNSGKGARNPNQ